MSDELGPRVSAFVAAAPGVDAVTRVRLLEVMARLATTPGRVLVATCHRVELFVGERAISHDEVAPLIRNGADRLEGLDAARHLVELALGLRSAVLAEDQILHQVRRAVIDARRNGPLGVDLDRLADVALRAGRAGRSWRPASRSDPAASMGRLAIDRVRSALGSLRGARILVVGAGPMGQDAVAAATGAGAIVRIASVSTEHAREVADLHGATLSPIDPGEAMASLDAVVVALAGPWQIATASQDFVASRPIVVDLSMPPSLPAGLPDRLGDRLIDIDGLAGGTAETDRQARYRRRLVALAGQVLDEYVSTQASRARSGADRLAERIEAQRTRQLEAWLRERPDLDHDARRLLDSVTRDLADRLFRVPLERLAHDPDGRRRRAADELFG
ncbi:MAG: NAD(P)-binding domain-containing protein [Chloroflexota bacterium]